MPIHVLVYKVGRRTCVLLSLFPLLFYPACSVASGLEKPLLVGYCYFEANGHISSISGSYSFLRTACHDIFSLSHHLLASWNS